MTKPKPTAHWHPHEFIKLVSPAFIILIFGWLGVHFLTGSKAATVTGGIAQLYLSPATNSVVQNQQFSVTVRVNANSAMLNAVRADITYPASSLEFVSTTNPCVDPPFGVTAENTPTPGTPTPGEVKIACGSFNGFSGDQAIATLTFKALGNSGTASIAFAATSEALLLSDSSNTLGSTTPSVITLTAQAPTISGVAPASGSSLGGTAVTITGTNFVGTPTVKFGATNATGVTLVSPTTITATTPAGSLGATTVSVTVGSQTTTKAAGFTYSDVLAPTKPGTPTLTANEANRVSFNWTASTDTGGSGVAGYRVYRNGTQLGTSLVASNSYIDSAVLSKTAYSYTVAAVDAAGNVGPQSNALSLTTRLNGDVDSNGVVNLTDLSILLSNWNKTVVSPADLNHDGVVNLTDLSMLLANWLKTTP